MCCFQICPFQKSIVSSVPLQVDSMRIVSVCPSNTDLCAHLGVLDQVVGRDTWSDWPEDQVLGMAGQGQGQG